MGSTTFTGPVVSNNGMEIVTGNLIIDAGAIVLNGQTISNINIPAITPTVSITSTQILALNTTAIQVIAAPGAGLALIPMKAVITLSAGTAYTIGSATNLELKYTNASGVVCSGTLSSTGFLDQAAGLTAVFAGATSSFIPAANAAVMLFLAGGNVTLGTGAIKIQVEYLTVPVPVV